MNLLKLKLRRVLDGDDAFLVRDKARQRVQRRRLARTRAARDQHVQPRADDRLQEKRHILGERAEFDQLMETIASRLDLSIERFMGSKPAGAVAP